MEMYADETYSEIAELMYVKQGSSWKFDTLTANCNFSVELDTVVPLSLPSNVSDFFIRLWTETGVGTEVVHPEADSLLRRNSVSSSNPAAIYYPQLRKVDVNGNDVVLGQLGLGIGPEKPPELEGTIWAHVNAIANSSFNQINSTWLVAHELTHLVGRVSHDASSPSFEGTWWNFLSVTTSGAGETRLVWNGRLTSDAVSETTFRSTDLIAPIRTDENGAIRSECDVLRLDSLNYLAP